MMRGKKITSYLKVLFKDYARSILRSLKDKYLAGGITRYITDIVTAELKGHVLHSLSYFSSRNITDILWTLNLPTEKPVTFTPLLSFPPPYFKNGKIQF